MAGAAQSPGPLSASDRGWGPSHHACGTGTVDRCSSQLQCLLSPLHTQPLELIRTVPQSFLVVVSHGQSFLVPRGWGSQSPASHLGGKVGAPKPPLGPVSMTAESSLVLL